MKKLLFYTNAKIYDKAAGITKKVSAQAEAFQKLGYRVYYSAYTQEGAAIFDGEKRIVKSDKFLTQNSRIHRFLRRKNIIRFITEYIEEQTEGFDIFYARYHFFDSTYLSMLKAARKKADKVIIEAHAYPSLPKGINEYLPIAVIDWIWAKRVHRYIDYVAAMCEFDELWGKPAVRISNTVDIEKISMRIPSVNRKKEKEIHLISVAYEGRVHGLDRVLRGIDQYKKNGGEWDFAVHFVGTVLNSTRVLAENSPNHLNYIFYGTKSGKQLDEIYNKADIAIGVLAPHRNNSKSGSALKTQEYLAKGIPFINAWKEEGIGEDSLFIQEIGDSEEPLDMKLVIDLYQRTSVVENLPEKMRDSIREKSGWVNQMKKVVDYGK